VHGTCYVPVSLPKEKQGKQQLPTTFKGICLQCIETNHLDIRNSGNMAKRYIFGGKVTVRPWIERALQKDFPPIRIIEAEESSESSDTSEDEMQETARETDVEMKNSLPSTAARDMNTENASIAEEQPMDIEDQDGYSDDDTVPQSTKDSTNGKSGMHQSHSTAPSTLQSENQQIYLDLHLIVPETPKEEGPPEVIATLRKRLLEFMKEVQELEPSFKLHTINP
jgi:ABC-type phosphate transport system substrate-binding protein